jgi:hypothetical protein
MSRCPRRNHTAVFKAKVAFYPTDEELSVGWKAGRLSANRGPRHAVVA